MKQGWKVFTGCPTRRDTPNQLKLGTTKVFLNAENLYTPKSPPISIENLCNLEKSCFSTQKNIWGVKIQGEGLRVGKFYGTPCRWWSLTCEACHQMSFQSSFSIAGEGSAATYMAMEASPTSSTTPEDVQSASDTCVRLGLGRELG